MTHDPNHIYHFAPDGKTLVSGPGAPDPHVHTKIQDPHTGTFKSLVWADLDIMVGGKLITVGKVEVMIENMPSSLIPYEPLDTSNDPHP